MREQVPSPRWTRARARFTDQDGNGLVLMPVAVLIVLGLAGMAIDTASTFRVQRALQDLAGGIANDVAGAAIDIDAYYADADPDTSTFVLDPARVEQVVGAHLAARNAAGDPLEPSCTALPASATPRVTVTCQGTSNPIFRLLHGGADQVTLQATATADLQPGP